jgi:transcriptional regulator with XRE-family HTH domain
MVLFRRLLGEVLRRHRQRQGRTLRDVAASARVSLGYLSEVERGLKEASSELLTAVCEALGVSLADVLREISDELVALERRPLHSVGFAATGRTSTRPAAPVLRSVAGAVRDGERPAMTPAPRHVAPVASLSVSLSARTLPVVAA